MVNEPTVDKTFFTTSPLHWRKPRRAQRKKLRFQEPKNAMFAAVQVQLQAVKLERVRVVMVRAGFRLRGEALLACLFKLLFALSAVEKEDLLKLHVGLVVGQV